MLQILSGKDVLAESACFFGDLVEEVGIDVSANTKIEDSGLKTGFTELVGDFLDDVVLPGLSNRGAAIGEEEHLCQAIALFALVINRFQGCAKGFINGGTAGSPELFHKTEGFLLVLFIGNFEFVEQRFGFGGKTNDVETVIGVEALDAELHGFLGLLHFLPIHGTGGIENKEDIFG